MILRHVFYFLLVLCNLGFSQDYSEVDNKVKNYPEFKDLSTLNIRIQNDFNKDIERVRAAYVWLSYNVKYNRSLDNIFKVKSTIIYYSERGKKLQIKKLEEKKVKDTFKFKQGVCLDYSLLLDYLFNEFEIESKIVYGISKKNIKHFIEKQVMKSHSWNAVQINSDWFLLDAAWASFGYLNKTTKHLGKPYLEHYFLTPPDEFIKDHFPAAPNWQLLEKKISLIDFFKSPIFYPNFFDTEISLTPNTDGLINNIGKMKTLSFTQIPKDGNLYYNTNNSYTLKKLKLKKRENNSYEVILKNLDKNNSLTIYHEQKAILSFKIDSNIEK